MASSGKLRIGNCEVGPGFPCYIIAEAGSNHDGDIEKAFKLVDIAKAAGANCVKFQSVTFDSLTADGGNDELRAAVDKITLDEEWHKRLKDYCDKTDIHFMSTPIYNEAVDWLDSLDVVGFKIASMDLTNLQFISYVAQKGRPVILSRGMSNISEIGTAIDEVLNSGNDQVALLHCIANYPTLPDQVNLRQIPVIRDAFGIVTGFSDHTESEAIVSAAIALGACIVEKHYTYNRNEEGFDHSYALEPDMLERMIRGIRESEQALGQTYVRYHETEFPTKQAAQRSIIVASPIKKGETLSEYNLTKKRPGTGITPQFWDFVVGRKAARDLERNHILSMSDFE